MLYVNDTCKCHTSLTVPRFLLSDFGFTKFVTGHGFSSGRYGANGYRAPELIKLNKFSDKTDIWAFGCVLMEVVSTGRCFAFRDDIIALYYSDGVEGYSLPKLERADNPELDQVLLNGFNSMLALCLNPNADERPSAEKLYQIVMQLEMMDEKVKENTLK